MAIQLQLERDLWKTFEEDFEILNRKFHRIISIKIRWNVKKSEMSYRMIGREVHIREFKGVSPEQVAEFIMKLEKAEIIFVKEII